MDVKSQLQKFRGQRTKALFNLIKHHAMKSGGISPRILNFGIEWSGMVSLRGNSH
jgi:hypothetical protein